MVGRTARSLEGRRTLDDSVAMALVASRALVGVAARSLSALEPDVTLPQYRALVLLSSRGEQNVGTLADALGIHPSTATRLCDRLLTKGLIDRATSVGNRREVTVTLSSEGRALVSAVMRSRHRELRRIVGRIDPQARRALIDAFDAFAVAAGELPDDAWKLGWTA
jgi:DNA-binding MarR family transcriptional regulator